MTPKIQNMIQNLCGLSVLSITQKANDLLFDIAFESYLTEDLIDPKHVNDQNVDVYCEIDFELINIGCSPMIIMRDSCPKCDT